MKDNTEILYFSVLVELLKEHPQTAGLKVQSEAFFEKPDGEDLDTAMKAVTSGRTSNGSASVNSIFEHFGKTATSYTKPLALEPLSIKRDSGFPNGVNDPNWHKGFQDDLDTIAFDSLENLKANTETLLFVIQKWTSNLASGCGEDIPFYDVAKLTAAAYICLQKADDKKMPFLFVSGGVSGIQDYLFDIVSKNAAKNLKGRSFYLHVLVEVILHKIMKCLNVYLTNVVYASGGNYLLLVPNTKENIKHLEDLKKDISNSLFDTHHIGLYTELAWLETDIDTLQNNYSEIGKELTVLIGADKRHKFNRQILNQFGKLFEAIEEGGETRKDVITNEEILETEESKTYFLNEAVPLKAKTEEFKEGINLVNRKTAYQILLGFGLKSAKTIKPDDWQIIQDEVGRAFPVILGVDPELTQKGDKLSFGKYELAVNETDKFDKNKISLVQGFQFYGGNNYPRIQLVKGKEIVWSPKTFSEMAGQLETEKDKKGNALRTYYLKDDKPIQEADFKRFGVLRMDVDGLGKIFKHEVKSVVVHSTLSRNVDWFFKGYLNTIWEEKYKDDTQIIYSGGDDLFIVGRWHELILFAKDIREEFKKWVVEHGKLSISGGISLVTSKFPVIKAAEYAGEAEDGAKKHKIVRLGYPSNHAGKKEYKFYSLMPPIQEETEYKKEDYLKKDSFLMMGVRMNWGYEFKAVEFLKNKLVRLISLTNKPLPRSFLFKTSGYYEETLPKGDINTAEYKKEKLERQRGRWVWQMAYDFTRMQERCKPRKEDSTEVVDFLQELINWTIGKEKQTPPSVSKHIDVAEIDYFTFFKFLNLACIWASYELQDKGFNLRAKVDYDKESDEQDFDNN
jgi:CRISPR-associated protein Csm1